MTDQPYTTEVDVRFSDVDAMGHVNNAVYATYLEEARTDYFEDVLGLTLDDVDTVLASLSLDFQRPIEGLQPVDVSLWIPELGESSIPMEYELRTDGDVAATGETVQVVYDRERGSSRAIPSAWRDRITVHGPRDGE